MLASLVTVVACGGSVVFVEDDDGAGGTSSTTSSSKQTSTGKTTGAVTTGPGTTNVVTTVGPTTDSGVTTGPGPQPVCAFGAITDECNSCAEQAQFEDCEIQTNACGSSDACFAYGDCIFQCSNNQGCCNACAAENPEGAKLYTDIVYCLVCQACPMECFGAVPGLCQ